jgi:hypothetical protein
MLAGVAAFIVFRFCRHILRLHFKALVASELADLTVRIDEVSRSMGLSIETMQALVHANGEAKAALDNLRLRTVAMEGRQELLLNRLLSLPTSYRQGAAAATKTAKEKEKTAT